MQIFIGSDHDGFELKEFIKTSLQTLAYTVIDVSENADIDFVESVTKIVVNLKENRHALGIAFDAYGAGSFMAATKHKGIIAAQVSDERSAYMTKEHNNARLLTLGAEIVGHKLAKNIVLEFLKATYDGGRHQIRVDMLNKMG